MKNMNDEFSVLIQNKTEFEKGNTGGVFLRLPATEAELDDALKSQNITADNLQDFFLNGVAVSETRYIEIPHDWVRDGDLDKLNYFAARWESLNPEQIAKLDAVMHSDFKPQSLDELINQTFNVDFYSHIPGVFTFKELGDYFINDSGKVQMPEEWKMGVDLEDFGYMAALSEEGKLTDYGYIAKSGEPWKEVYFEKEMPDDFRIMSNLKDRYEEQRGTITSSEIVEGLTYRMWNDGSGCALLNGEKLGSIDLETKEIKIGEKGWIPMPYDTTDEIKSEFRKRVEKLAVEKGAKLIDSIQERVDRETEPVRGNDQAEQTAGNIYKYYFGQDALSKGSYPYENFEGITEYEELTSVPGINQKVLGELRYSKPLTKEQEREYRLISDQAGNREKKVTLKEEFDSAPLAVLEKMKKEHSELACLSAVQLSYIAKSDYVKTEYGNLLKTDPSKFANITAKRAESLDKVISKNGVFVEINYCEQWTDKPIVQGGAILHPKVADTIIKQAEIQIQGLKAEAEKAGEYFPYNKCKLTVFSKSGAELELTTYQTRVSIGDGRQISLSDHLSQLCGKESDIVAAFDKSVRENGAKDKMIFNDVPGTTNVEIQKEKGTPLPLKLSEEEIKSVNHPVKPKSLAERISDKKAQIDVKSKNGKDKLQQDIPKNKRGEQSL